MFTVVFGEVRVVHRGIWWVRVVHLFSLQCCTLVLYVHRGIWWGPCCSPWYLVGFVLLICLVCNVVLWCCMFTVVFGGVRVAHLFSFLYFVLVLYVHRGIW